MLLAHDDVAARRAVGAHGQHGAPLAVNPFAAVGAHIEVVIHVSVQSADGQGVAVGGCLRALGIGVKARGSVAHFPLRGGSGGHLAPSQGHVVVADVQGRHLARVLAAGCRLHHHVVYSAEVVGRCVAGVNGVRGLPAEGDACIGGNVVAYGGKVKAVQVVQHAVVRGDAVQRREVGGVVDNVAYQQGSPAAGGHAVVHAQHHLVDGLVEGGQHGELLGSEVQHVFGVVLIAAVVVAVGYQCQVGVVGRHAAIVVGARGLAYAAVVDGCGGGGVAAVASVAQHLPAVGQGCLGVVGAARIVVTAEVDGVGENLVAAAGCTRGAEGKQGLPLVGVAAAADGPHADGMAAVGHPRAVAVRAVVHHRQAVALFHLPHIGVAALPGHAQRAVVKGKTRRVAARGGTAHAEIVDARGVAVLADALHDDVHRPAQGDGGRIFIPAGAAHHRLIAGVSVGVEQHGASRCVGAVVGPHLHALVGLAGAAPVAFHPQAHLVAVGLCNAEHGRHEVGLCRALHVGQTHHPGAAVGRAAVAAPQACAGAADVACGPAGGYGAGGGEGLKVLAVGSGAVQHYGIARHGEADGASPL